MTIDETAIRQWADRHECRSNLPEPKIIYSAGSIENPETNKRVVDVLEGTKKAFDNRGGKYHSQSEEIR